MGQEGQAQGAVALAEPGATRSHHQTQVGVGRAWQAKGLLKADLGGGDTAQILAPDDLRHALGAIVHHHRQVVGVAAVPAVQERIPRGPGGIIDPGSQQKVLPGHGAGHKPEAEGVRPQEGQRPVAAGARVGPQAVLAMGRQGQGGQVLAGTGAGVEEAVLVEPLERALVGRSAPGLPQYGTVAFQPQGRQIPQLGLPQAGPAPRRVHVLHADEPPPPLGPRRQPRRQGRAEVPEVEFPGGRGGETAGAGHGTMIFGPGPQRASPPHRHDLLNY